MYTTKSVDINGTNWIELVCGSCAKVEVFGTASAWAPGELSALIARMGWKIGEKDNTCSRCARKLIVEL